MESVPYPNQAQVGWLYVATQAVLLIALIALPSADHWPIPPWLRTVALGATALGFVVVMLAAFGLGRNLTPTPVPKEHGALVTDGVYRYSRHPIYSGVLLVVLGIVVGSGNLLTLAIGVLTVLFFNSKARWEEQRLRERYPDYDAYAAVTGRFGPWSPTKLGDSAGRP